MAICLTFSFWLVWLASAAGRNASSPIIQDNDVYSGSYICYQGSTGITMHVDNWPFARFKFFPTPLSTHNCSGEFLMRGHIHGKTGDWAPQPGDESLLSNTVSFIARSYHKWIHNECNYDTVDMTGYFLENGMRLVGNISHPGCTEFSMIKAGVSAHTCFNTDNGFLDSRERSCEAYSEAAQCGKWDKAGFNATAMCCACGGGLQEGLATAACFDWHDVSHRGSCAWYEENADKCDQHNSNGWRPRNKCCACGGGVQAIGGSLRREIADTRATEAELKREYRELRQNSTEMESTLRVAKMMLAAEKAVGDKCKALATNVTILKNQLEESDHLLGDETSEMRAMFYQKQKLEVDNGVLESRNKHLQDSAEEMLSEKQVLIGKLQEVEIQLQAARHSFALMSKKYHESKSAYALVPIAMVLTSLLTIGALRACPAAGFRLLGLGIGVRDLDESVFMHPASTRLEPEREMQSLIDEGL